MIQSQIVADSIDPRGNRLSTFLVTFPRIILAELNTHRAFSRNSASSRAIPFNKMVESVKTNPFLPLAWQRDHKGMQGTEYFKPAQDEHDKEGTESLEQLWLEARDSAVYYATQLHNSGVTKQLCNRLLEPFMYHTVLLTSSKEGLENFFDLRCSVYEVYENTGKTNENTQILQFKSKKDAIKACPDLYDLTDLEWLQINKGQAEIHMMALAEAMWDSYNESIPKQLKEGEWHIPFEDKMMMSILDQHDIAHKFPDIKSKIDLKIRISTGMCARTSYTVVGDEKEVSYETLIGIHDKMLDMKPFHASPYEHCAKVMNEEEFTFHYYRGSLTDRNEKKLNNGWCRNYKGFIQYRHLIENQ